MIADYQICTQLPDGTPVLVRSVRPSDADALRRGFQDLSQHSRLMRFLASMPRLSEADVTRFVSPDQRRHIAVGAVVLEDPHAPVPAGIAHYFRTTDTSPRAELALTVVDAFQGRGLGTLLLGRLLRVAAAGRITELDALLHPQNRAMAGLLTALGARPVSNSADRAFVLPVHADPSCYPDTRAADAVRTAWHLPPDRAAA